MFRTTSQERCDQGRVAIHKLSEIANAPDHHCFGDHLFGRRDRSCSDVVRERGDEWKHGRIDLTWDRVASHTGARWFPRTDADAERSNHTEPFKL